MATRRPAQAAYSPRPQHPPYGQHNYPYPTGGEGSSGAPPGPANPKAGEPTNPAALKVWDWHTRKVLRPYPIHEGDIFFNPPNVKEKTYLAPKNYAALLTCDNSELCRRMGVGISILCGTQAHLAQYFEKFEHAYANARTGIKEWAEILASPEGQQFLDACRVMNMGGASSLAKTLDTVNPDAVSLHTRRFLRFLARNNEERSAVLGRIMRYCGRLFLSASHLLEAFALMKDPELWADKYSPKVPRHTAWFSQPEDAALLRDFISDALMENVARRRPVGGKNDLLEMSDDDADDDLQASTRQARLSGSAQPKRKSKQRARGTRGLDSTSSDEAAGQNLRNISRKRGKPDDGAASDSSLLAPPPPKAARKEQKKPEAAPDAALEAMIARAVAQSLAQSVAAAPAQTALEETPDRSPALPLPAQQPASAPGDPQHPEQAPTATGERKKKKKKKPRQPVATGPVDPTVAGPDVAPPADP